MKNLYVEGFGPITKAELDLRDMNLLIGEQSIGKSTLAKLITIMTDYSCLALMISAGLNGWLQHLVTYNLSIYKDDKYFIKYDLTEGNVCFHLEIRPEKVTSYVLSPEGKVVRSKKKIQESIMSLKPIYHHDKFSEHLSAAVKEAENSGDYYRIVNSLRELLYNSLYIPAERIVYSIVSKLLPALNLMKDSMPTTLLRFIVELTNAQAKNPQYKAALLGIEYVRENAEDFFIEGQSKKKLPLSYASSGIQSTLPLLMVLDYAVSNREYSSFVIEEPELNLFPSKQVELFRFILSAVKKERRTLTITTHSPYLLSAVNNSLFAGNLLAKYGDEIRPLLPEIPLLLPGECSVYSLGETINGSGVYCTSILDEETGMVSTSGLDAVSFAVGEEFEKIEAAFLHLNNRK